MPVELVQQGEERVLTAYRHEFVAVSRERGGARRSRVGRCGAFEKRIVAETGSYSFQLSRFNKTPR